MSSPFSELMKEMKRVCLVLADAHEQAAKVFEELSQHPEVQEFFEQEEKRRKKENIPFYAGGGQFGNQFDIAILKHNTKDYRDQAKEIYGNPDITFEEYLNLSEKYVRKQDKSP